MVYVTAVLTEAGALLLLAAGLVHLRGRRDFAALLAAHGLFWRPARARRGPLTPTSLAAATTIAVTELLVGSLVAACALLATNGHGAPLVTAVAAQALLYTGLVAYLFTLRRLRPGVECGCGPYPEPVGHAATLRAGLLALATYLVLLVSVAQDSPLAHPDPLETTLSWGMAVAVAVLLATLPAELAELERLAELREREAATQS